MSGFQIWLVSTLRHINPVYEFMNSKWGWPTAESVHFLGLSLLVGCIGVFDLRLLGLGKRIPIAALHRLIPWGLTGYAINLVSGAAFLMTEPNQYIYNPSFHFKLLFMAVAGFNATAFYLTAYRPATAPGAAADAPRPYRLPHPPLRMAATTPETFPRVARMGLPIFVGLRGMSIPELAEHLRVYREAWREAGHAGDGDACLRIPVYAAPTEKAAVNEPRETITYYIQRQADLTRAPIGRAGTGPAERRVAQAQRLSSLSYDEILTTKVGFGTGPGLIDRLTQLKEELGVTGIAAELNPGGLLSPNQEMRSLRILTHEVMPAFK
jgi:hypothetical protein